MKHYQWDPVKNDLLKSERGICFEDVVFYLETGALLDSYAHPNQSRYPGQKLYVVEIGSYAFLVPCIESGSEIFLKTVIPSRKATRKFLRTQGDNHETDL